MFKTILNLFGRSPFAPLQLHMEQVSQCVHLLPKLFEAIDKQDREAVQEIANKISELEHQADLSKNDIRNHLPKSLFLPIDRSRLLEILAIQDSLADAAEDIAVLANLYPIVLLDEFKEVFFTFLHKNIEAFDGAFLIIKEMNELLESSFGGSEAHKVRTMVDDVAFKEHEVDLLQRNLLKLFFQKEANLALPAFLLWTRIFEATAALSNLSENLANRVRMSLELK